MAASDQEGMEEGSGGSWLPLVVIFVVLFFRWAAYGQGNVPIRMRRWYNLQVGNEKIFERRPFEVFLLQVAVWKLLDNTFFYGT
jgi:hypothetical protein